MRKHIESVHEGIKPFKCKFCDYESGQKSSLKEHIKSVHEGIKPFKCKLCDYESGQKSSLKEHIESVHEGIKPFQCHICKYKSATKSKLKRHITFVHEKKNSENNLCDDQEVSFQSIKLETNCDELHNEEVSFQSIKVEPSVLNQSQTSDTADPLLIHQMKRETFEENVVTPMQDLATVYIKQEEEFDAFGNQNVQKNGIKKEFVLGE